MNAKLVVKRVDASNEGMAHCIHWLQSSCLPHDEPRSLKGDVWWIAYKDGLPVGFAALRLLDKHTAYLSRAGVLPAARGCGIQKRMIRSRIRFAREQGCTSVITDTADNPPSANSLISAGFKMYNPEYRWALPNSNYWMKTL